MPSYNPNGVWDSKEPKYAYDPDTVGAVKPNKPAAPPTNSSFTGKNPPTIPRSGGSSGSANEPEDQPSFFHRHRGIIITLIALVAIGLIGLVIYLILPAAPPNIDITFSDPGTVTLGEPFPVTVTISNTSANVLQNAQLNITAPNGLSFVGEDPTQRVLVAQVGTLSSKTINPPQEIDLIATGIPGNAQFPGSTQHIDAKLTYSTSNTAATQFEADGGTDLAIGTQSAVAVNYAAPASIFSGGNFDLAVEYANNTSATIQSAQFTMQYPPAFHYVSSSGTVPIDPADDTWDLGALGPDATGTLVITGNIVGPTEAQYQLAGTLTGNYSGQNYPIFSAPANFTITAAPLSLTVTANGSSSYVSGAGDSLDYELTYTNNSNVQFQAMSITASLVGQMFDFTSLKTPATFNSQNDALTWYTANTPQLASLAPGQSGSVSFTIKTNPKFPTHGANYTLKVNAQIQSPTVPPNTAGTSTASSAAIVTKLQGGLSFNASVYAHEPTATIIKNAGPYPPKVNTPTEYTIHWDLTNYSTDAKNVTISATLQSGTTFTGAVQTNIPSSTPTFDPVTGKVTWTIPLLAATTGVSSQPAEAIFQVSNTPAVNQVGSAVSLIGPATATAVDNFTGSPLTASADPLGTGDMSDSSISKSSSGQVTQ